MLSLLLVEQIFDEAQVHLLEKAADFVIRM